MKKPVLQLSDFDKLPFTKRGPKLTAQDRKARKKIDDEILKGDIQMKNFDPTIAEMFNINTAYIMIAEAAKNNSSAGHLHLWIYLVDRKLQFHYVELTVLGEFLVAHFRCQTILKGMSAKAWQQLGARIATVLEKGRSL